MKTNFEKWRDTLTPEAFYENRKDSCVIALPCSNCPARAFCNEADYSIECKDNFTAWANAPAKEDK